MPLVDTGGDPYPLTQDVMNLARVRVNDCAISLDGNLLSNNQPYTNTILQAAWRWLQTKCAVAGVETFIRSTYIQGIPAAAKQDTAYECYLTWEGCGDGVFQYEAPGLPPDLILPLHIGYRQSGTQNNFNDLDQALDGLPRYLNVNVYDWRDDGMYFYGWSVAADIKLRYAAYRAPLNLGDPQNQATIMFCEDALSARIAYEFANLRGAAQAPAMMQAAEDAFDVIAQRTARKNQRRAIRRRPYSGRSTGWNYPTVRNN